MPAEKTSDNTRQNLQLDDNLYLKTAEQGTPSVKITDGTETLGIDTSNRAVCSVTSLMPDGTHTLPPGDASNRAIYVRQLVDGAGLMASGNANINRQYVQVCDASANANVTSDSQLETKPLAAKGQTAIIKSDTATNTTTTIHTVTTGKTFYLCGASLASNQDSNSGPAKLLIGGVALLQINRFQDTGFRVEESRNTSLSLAAPLPVSAGTTIQVYSSDAGLDAFGSVIGWEE